MNNLPISAIIPAKNMEKTIENCLDSVQKNNPAEIIVVDGNSSDRTVEIARGYTEKIYSDEGKGTSYAHQLGAEQASQEYIAYVDADIVMPDGTLSTLLTELKASGYANIHAKLTPGNRYTYWERAHEQLFQILKTKGVEGQGGLDCAVLRRDTVLNIKFDPSVKYFGNDLAFCSKLEKEGYKLGNSSAIFYHYHPTGLKVFVKYMFSTGRCDVHLAGKYKPWYAGLNPTLSIFYWTAFCLINGKPKLIPYVVLSGIMRAAGMVKGFYELLLRRG